MSNFIGDLVRAVRYSCAVEWLRWDVIFPVQDWWDTRYVALVEVVKGGVSVGMMRSPAYRLRWVAKLVSRGVAIKLRKHGDEFRVRILEPDAALELETRYSDWLMLMQRGLADK